MELVNKPTLQLVNIISRCVKYFQSCIISDFDHRIGREPYHFGGLNSSGVLQSQSKVHQSRENSLVVYCPKTVPLHLTELAYKSIKSKISSGEFSYPRFHRCLVACKAMDMARLEARNLFLEVCKYSVKRLNRTLLPFAPTEKDQYVMILQKG